ncbi:hypothetical protein [Acinetobacter sp. ANC 5378]|uniref:hypothetical protein n=1 Tax=Acinetobacter sp. ANC 5378 TaxID=2731249 RepID=UPI00148FC15F|nr:hypothetical protein [Acinetobacter sp. ANC 5378]NNG82238.1 hypothetical protein [Acinetobacter sp. ANC 5378]
MHIKPVKVYKMNEDFKISPKLVYTGEYDDEYNLMNVYNSSQEKLTRIMGTYQWILNSTGEIFFIEEDLPDLTD